MSAWRQVLELAIGEEDLQRLQGIARSRTEPASRVERARMLLAYRKDPSFFAVGRALGVHHQTVQRCVERAVAYGPLAALDDRPRPGKEPDDHGRGQGLAGGPGLSQGKGTGLSARAVDDAAAGPPRARAWTRRRGMTAWPSLPRAPCAKSSTGKPSRRTRCATTWNAVTPSSKTKMAEVLCVYREVAILKEAAAAAKDQSKPVAVVSYDEKPGIQAIANTAPDLPPKPGVHPSFARDFEYKRHGTLSLLAGIDLLTGKVHALVKDRHRSREFVEFLKLLDAAYPADTAIKLILDNHSAHISKETKAWLAAQPDGPLRSSPSRPSTAPGSI